MPRHPGVPVTYDASHGAMGPRATVEARQGAARRGVEWRRQPRYALIFMFLSIKSGHVARRKSPAEQHELQLLLLLSWLAACRADWLTDSTTLSSTPLHSPVLCPPSRSVVVLPWCLVPLLALVLFLVLALVLALSWLLSFVGH